MSGAPATIADIKHMLQARVKAKNHELVRKLLPSAVIKGGYATVSSSKPGSLGGSFVVWLGGTSAGAWKDFATGNKGDVLDLIAHAQFGYSSPMGKEARRDALAWARDYLGIAEMTPFELARVRNSVSADAAKAKDSEAEKAERAVRRALQMWLDAKPDLRGTVAERYLAGRGVAWREIPNLATDLRFTPKLEWWLGARRNAEGRKLEPGPSFPALVSAMRDATGALRAVHCTFLDPNGVGKAPVPKPKLMWPATRDLVIRIANGETGLAPEEAAVAGARGTVVLCEGIEDGLSVASARPDLRVWACGSLAGLAGAPVLPCVAAFIVAADNDWSSGQAMAGLEKAVETLRQRGVPGAVARSPTGKDFNDALAAGPREDFEAGMVAAYDGDGR